MKYKLAVTISLFLMTAGVFGKEVSTFAQWNCAMKGDVKCQMIMWNTASKNNNFRQAIKWYNLVKKTAYTGANAEMC